jgi:TDG/mug DNA glycosylase family protein
MSVVPDSISEGLLVLFVGFNPSPASTAAGHPYAHRSNRFYKILYSSALTPVLHLPSDSRHMRQLYGYGFTNIVARTTQRADELTKEDYDGGRQILIRKLHRYRPKIVCFVGKTVYHKYSLQRRSTFSFQDKSTIPGIYEFVGPATSGLVRMAFAEQVSIYKELSDFLNIIRATGYHPPTTED